MRLFFRSGGWRIGKAKRRLLELGHVYDVMFEQPVEGRYLVHIWVNDLDERVKGIVEPQIREIVRRRPRHIKVDVFLYRRDVG